MSVTVVNKGSSGLTVNNTATPSVKVNQGSSNPVNVTQQSGGVVKVVQSGTSAVKIAKVSVPSVKVTTPSVSVVKVNSISFNEAKLLPSGGAAGALLKKSSTSDYDVEWSTSGFGLFELVDDPTPTLGGKLDVSTFNLFTSATNKDIQFTPNGTGSINLDGTIKFKRFKTAPDAFEGGMYADEHDNLFFGVSD